MKYVVTYGDEYLKDYGEGWTRWTLEGGDAMRFTDRKVANIVATSVEGNVSLYLDATRPSAGCEVASFCGAV